MVAEAGGGLPWLSVLGYAGLAFWLWLFAASLAEAEGFSATGRVAAVLGAGLRRGGGVGDTIDPRNSGNGLNGRDTDMPDYGAQMTQLWVELAKDSLLRPRVAARRLLRLNVGQAQLLQLAVLVTCLGIILAYAALRLSSGSVDAVSAWVLDTPLLGALVEFGIMAVIAVLTYRVGALFGGTGTFWDAVALVIWLNTMLLLIQIAQLLTLATVPSLAAVLAIFAVFWALWAYANFVTELHGFDNPFMVLGGVILTAIVLFISLAMLFAMFGITPRGAA